MNLKELVVNSGIFIIPDTPREAVRLQQHLKENVRLVHLDPDQIKRIAAVDVSYNHQSKTATAGACVFDTEKKEIVDTAFAKTEIAFPYVPGLLAFREIPAVLEAFKKLDSEVDIIICDGHGILHPRGFGLASHLGVFLNFPTMGIAKNKLFGVETEEKKVYFDLEITFISHPQTGEKIGAAVRRVLKSRRRLKPIYISPGHLVDLKSAIELYIRISGRHRLPKVMRAADRISKTSS
jgi:deoxyribonuclease V